MAAYKTYGVFLEQAFREMWIPHSRAFLASHLRRRLRRSRGDGTNVSERRRRSTSGWLLGRSIYHHSVKS